MKGPPLITQAVAAIPIIIEVPVVLVLLAVNAPAEIALAIIMSKKHAKEQRLPQP